MRVDLEVYRKVREELAEVKIENEQLRDLIQETHAELLVWVICPVKTIYRGLEAGIATVPNSIPHCDLKEGIRRWERLEKKMCESFATRAKEPE